MRFPLLAYPAIGAGLAAAGGGAVAASHRPLTALALLGAAALAAESPGDHGLHVLDPPSLAAL